MSACRSCDAKVVWYTTEAKGKPIPLDLEPTTDGNVVLVPKGGRLGGALVARVLGPLELLTLEPDRIRYTPHHATCPDVEDWRA
jgi:hypothetical protein